GGGAPRQTAQASWSGPCASGVRHAQLRGLGTALDRWPAPGTEARSRSSTPSPRTVTPSWNGKGPEHLTVTSGPIAIVRKHISMVGKDHVFPGHLPFSSSCEHVCQLHMHESIRADPVLQVTDLAPVTDRACADRRSEVPSPGHDHAHRPCLQR